MAAEAPRHATAIWAVRRGGPGNRGWHARGTGGAHVSALAEQRSAAGVRRAGTASPHTAGVEFAAHAQILENVMRKVFLRLMNIAYMTRNTRLASLIKVYLGLCAHVNEGLVHTPSTLIFNPTWLLKRL